jgi:hypothetical protein
MRLKGFTIEGRCRPAEKLLARAAEDEAKEPIGR